MKRFIVAIVGVTGVFTIISVAFYIPSFGSEKTGVQSAVAVSAPTVVESQPAIIEVEEAPPAKAIPPIDQPGHVVVLSAVDTYAGPDYEYITVGQKSFGDAVMVVHCNPSCSWYETEEGAWIPAIALNSPPQNLPVREVTPIIELLKKAQPTATPFVLVLPTVTPTPAPTQAPVWTGAAVDYAIIRRGPGTTFEQVGVALPGDVLKVAARNVTGDWYQLKNGAWVAAFLVDQDFNDLPVAANIPAPPAGARDLEVTFSNPHYKCMQSFCSYEDIAGQTHQVWVYRSFEVEMSIHNLNTRPLLPVYAPTRWILSDGVTESVQTISWQAQRSGPAQHRQRTLHYDDKAHNRWILASMEREQWVRAVEFEWNGQIYRVDYDLATARESQNYRDCGESRNTSSD